MAGVANKLVTMLLVCALVVAPMTPVDATLSCGQVVGNLSPCLNYLKNGGPVPAPCCNGVRSLAGSAKTAPDRRQACQCLKTAAGGISGLKENYAAALPAACRVTIPYKISTKTNCNAYV
ncbi:unnamed protein product [Linum tenue]|uniref:Non-specific lipid-transfer protein n=3 Tax=Linum tenue TaxID=586396 RepID=A0AAV0KQ58_9ROSI|nr:unnamed protein product [Linum tenue]